LTWKEADFDIGAVAYIHCCCKKPLTKRIKTLNTRFLLKNKKVKKRLVENIADKYTKLFKPSE